MIVIVIVIVIVTVTVTVTVTVIVIVIVIVIRGTLKGVPTVKTPTSNCYVTFKSLSVT